MASTTINSTSENPASRPESTMAAECRQPRAATSRARSAFEAMERKEEKEYRRGQGPLHPIIFGWGRASGHVEYGNQRQFPGVRGRWPPV
ncbi:hypothetical protein NUTIK01_28480 [Novosphingobium sp. IK01]|uniref:Uncharacterized protein n=1 Tax=Novosphingobium pituita TaxID=3056842 RepID=A0ABQ6PBA0_9SPHN|nr:hypothetical protein NUTIK01_28480 [Novosphingobium sp. IK01]